MTANPPGENRRVIDETEDYGLRSCQNCRFWKLINRHSEFGECRRRAPAPMHEVAWRAARSQADRIFLSTAGPNDDPADPEGPDDQYGVERSSWWPTTFAGEWCGDLEPNTVETA